MIILSLKPGGIYVVVAGGDLLVDGGIKPVTPGLMFGPEKVLAMIDSGNRLLIRSGQGLRADR